MSNSELRRIRDNWDRRLARMVAALRPGGWLVVEEFDWSAMVRDPSDVATAARFDPGQHAMWRLITEHGGDGTYGHQLWAGPDGRPD